MSTDRTERWEYEFWSKSELLPYPWAIPIGPTNYVVDHSPLWEADSSSARQEFPAFL